MNLPIKVAGTDIEFPCAPGQTVLEAAETAGWAIPYSCRKGVCTSCMGGLRTGELAVRGRGTITGPAENVLLCRAEPLGPVEIEPRRIASQRPPQRKKLPTIVYRIRRPAPRVTVLDLRFPIGRRAPFRAGQYLTVHLPDGETRPYSLANSPQHNDAAELHIRTEPGGRFSEQLVSRLRPGDVLTVETPFGEFVLDDADEAPVILLATGTGFAPLKSIVADQINRRQRRPIHLYWGARTEEDLYLRELPQRWAMRYDWFRFTPVLSRPPAGWPGATGWVQQAVLADYPDLSGHQVYACGSEAMTTAAQTTLVAEANLPEDRFHADAFVPAAESNSPSESTVAGLLGG